MDATCFVKTLKIQASEAASVATMQALVDPPGRSVTPQQAALRDWFLGLKGEDQARLRGVVREATDTAVFNCLTILDGVTAVGDEPLSGRLELTYVSAAGAPSVLNDPQSEELHNLFAGLKGELPRPQPKAQAYEVGTARQLLEQLVVGDGLDIHHVPRKTAAQEMIESYAPASAPAIILPKHEHRNVSAEALDG